MPSQTWLLATFARLVWLLRHGILRITLRDVSAFCLPVCGAELLCAYRDEHYRLVCSPSRTVRCAPFCTTFPARFWLGVNLFWRGLLVGRRRHVFFSTLRAARGTDIRVMPWAHVPCGRTGWRSSAPAGRRLYLEAAATGRFSVAPALCWYAYGVAPGSGTFWRRSRRVLSLSGWKTLLWRTSLFLPATALLPFLQQFSQTAAGMVGGLACAPSCHYHICLGICLAVAWRHAYNPCWLPAMPSNSASLLMGRRTAWLLANMNMVLLCLLQQRILLPSCHSTYLPGRSSRFRMRSASNKLAMYTALFACYPLCAGGGRRKLPAVYGAAAGDCALP